MLIVALWLFLFHLLLRPSPRRSFRGRPFVPAPASSALLARKPAWVIEEVVRLKAHLPDHGCRVIALTFNRLHQAKHGMTVSLIWGVDLTGKTDTHGTVHPILGIVDHGSRLAVKLQALPTKATIAILRVLLDAIERHGRPRAIRTDNDGAFTSRLFGFVLWMLGIRHRRTEPHCPWQNGRVERFFGTLKAKLDRWSVDDNGQLRLALADFRAWYNHVRPHQHLGGLTPVESWTRLDPYAGVPREVRYYSAWDGMLTGYWMRR